MPNQKCRLYAKKLDSCFDLFKAKGIRSVSIQDIVRFSNIPKKELYNTFGNKEGIIKEVLNQDLLISTEIFESVGSKSKNAIDELLNVNRKLITRYGNVNQVLFFDLRKYYNDICLAHNEKKLELQVDFIIANLKRGISENLFRNDIDLQIVARLWISKFELIQEQKWFPLSQFDLSHLAEEFVNLHLRSICSPLGLKTLNTYLEKENILQS